MANNERQDINVVNQMVKLTYRNNGVTVEYSLKPTDDTNPFAVIDVIDRLTFAIVEITSEDVSSDIVKQSANDHPTTYKAKCDNCGNIAVVTFKPRANKPFLCNECYKAKTFKGETRILG